jgi:Arc/MetJ-type ribon-helix-helix transcriptional regulator
MSKDKTKRGTALSANMPLPLAQAVYAQVKNGSHDSAGAVIRAALRLYLRLDEDDQPLPPLDAEEPANKRRRGKRAPDPVDGD